MPELAANAECTGGVGLVEAQARDPPARWWSAACVRRCASRYYCPFRFQTVRSRRNSRTHPTPESADRSARTVAQPIPPCRLDARGLSGQLQVRWNGNAQEADECDQNENDLGNRDSAWVTLQHPGAPEGSIGLAHGAVRWNPSRIFFRRTRCAALEFLPR